MSKHNSATMPVVEEIYANVMETLISEAVDRRLAKLPPQQASYVNRVQVMTYALNRVPPLYASSREGFDRQCKRARYQLSGEILQAVNQAFAAVQRDPLKSSTPLCQERDETLVDAEQALNKIREAFHREDLSWEAVANWVVRAVHRRRSTVGKPQKDAARPGETSGRFQARSSRQRASEDNTQVPITNDMPSISDFKYHHHD